MATCLQRSVSVLFTELTGLLLVPLCPCSIYFMVPFNVGIQDNDCIFRYWGQALRTTAVSSHHYFLTMKAKGGPKQTFPTIPS